MDRHRLNLEDNIGFTSGQIAIFIGDLYSTSRLDNLSERDRIKVKKLLDAYHDACSSLISYVSSNPSGVFDHLKKCVNDDLKRRDESPRAQTESLSTILTNKKQEYN